MNECYLFPKKPLQWNSTNRAHSFLPKQMAHAEVREFLRVKENPRYTPTPSTTYCNVAAHDFATLRGYYLPRVWWINPMRDEAPVYGETVKELNANSLFDWFEAHSEKFNWAKMHGWKIALDVVCLGGMAVIVAKRKDRKLSGHISVINPQPGHQIGQAPDQWQAGRVNSENLRSLWYMSEKYSDFGIWATR
jgi:hypothetical protein